jgi:Tol biopolymer transport system component
VSPSALGDGTAYRLAVPTASSDCLGFAIETTDGTSTGCTPRPADVSLINTGYSAAADGSVVFMANDNTDPSSGDQGSIWLVEPDGSAVHLDDSTWDLDPTISYDGSKVVFARFDPTTWSSDLYSINSDGSDLQLVVSGGGTNYLTMPSISPDGSAIAYWCGPAVNATSPGPGCGPLTDGSYRGWGVMRANIDGTDPRMIVIGAGEANEVAGGSSLSWSPDGRWLAMTGLSEAGNHQVFAYHTDASDLFDNLDPTRQITHETDPWGPAYPQFSPDGSQIFYMRFVDDDGVGGNFTYLMGVDGTNRQELPVGYGAFVPTATPVAPPPLVDMTHITVPSVEALDLGSATQHLDAKNLTVGTVTYQHSATVGKNLVVSQAPAAGTTAHRTEKQGPPVNLVVSLGPAPSTVCVVPKVKGKSLRTAKQRLTAAHCQAGTIKRAFSRTVRKGHVVAERPGSGRKLHDGARVALTVSKGRRR